MVDGKARQRKEIPRASWLAGLWALGLGENLPQWMWWMSDRRWFWPSTSGLHMNPRVLLSTQSCAHRQTWIHTTQTHGNGKRELNSPSHRAWRWEEVSRKTLASCVVFPYSDCSCHTWRPVRTANPAEQGLVSLLQQLGQVGSPLMPK